MSTEKQLKERWETPEGKKVKELILKFARDFLESKTKSGE